MDLKVLVLTLCLVSCVSLVEGVPPPNPPYWNDLRKSFLLLKVTVGSVEKYGEEMSSGKDASGAPSDKLYRKLGRTLTELQSRKWTRLDPQADCENNGRFNGYQWFDPEEPLSYVLLVDVQGTVAGIQLFVPYHEVLRPGQNYRYGESPMMQNVTISNVPYYYITAYFIEPCLICSSGRSPSSLETQGTATGIYFQYGSSPTDILHAPLSRGKADQYGYERNNCWRGMGWHAYYKQPSWNLDACTTYRPEFMMYDNLGELRAFGFVVTGTVTAPAMEKPGPVISEAISGRPIPGISAPKCLTDLDKEFGLSTLHVFLTERPHEFSCGFPWLMDAYISGGSYAIKDHLGLG